MSKSWIETIENTGVQGHKQLQSSKKQVAESLSIICQRLKNIKNEHQ